MRMGSRVREKKREFATLHSPSQFCFSVETIDPDPRFFLFLRTCQTLYREGRGRTTDRNIRIFKFHDLEKVAWSVTWHEIDEAMKVGSNNTIYSFFFFNRRS